MDKDLLKELNNFLGKAAVKTYAGKGPEADPEIPGFKELEYQEGKWYYKDSYSGFFRSWGREVVWRNKKPVWCCLYGGGMTKGRDRNTEFAHETFGFLKKALSTGEKRKKFQPRGPRYFREDDWEYSCVWEGNISNFEGNEKISHKKGVVFTHTFIGGVIKTK